MNRWKVYEKERARKSREGEREKERARKSREREREREKEADEGNREKEMRFILKGNKCN